MLVRTCLRARCAETCLRCCGWMASHGGNRERALPRARGRHTLRLSHIQHASRYRRLEQQRVWPKRGGKRGCDTRGHNAARPARPLRGRSGVLVCDGLYGRVLACVGRAGAARAHWSIRGHAAGGPSQRQAHRHAGTRCSVRAAAHSSAAPPPVAPLCQHPRSPSKSLSRLSFLPHPSAPLPPAEKKKNKRIDGTPSAVRQMCVHLQYHGDLSNMCAGGQRGQDQCPFGCRLCYLCR